MNFKTAEIFVISLFIMSYREKIGLHVFFNSAHFLFFYIYSAKSAHSLEFECVWIFLIASTIQKILKK